jgi:hypothetical protein
MLAMQSSRLTAKFLICAGYAWFVNAENVAGTGPWSTYLAFQVGGVSDIVTVALHDND